MKEIKLLSKMEEGSFIDDDLGVYKVITEGVDDIIIIKNYKYRDLQYAEVTSLNDHQKCKIVDVENHDTYVVKPLDTLQSIANYHNTTTEEIKAINNLKNEKLFIGQMLKV